MDERPSRIRRAMADMHRRSPRLAIRHKVWLDAGRQFVLGDGGVALLRAIDSTGSIRAAANRAGWSYRHRSPISTTPNNHSAFGLSSEPVAARSAAELR
jgi:hypothetical protein